MPTTDPFRKFNSNIRAVPPMAMDRAIEIFRADMKIPVDPTPTVTPPALGIPTDPCPTSFDLGDYVVGFGERDDGLFSTSQAQRIHDIIMLAAEYQMRLPNGLDVSALNRRRREIDAYAADHTRPRDLFTDAQDRLALLSPPTSGIDWFSDDDRTRLNTALDYGIRHKRLHWYQKLWNGLKGFGKWLIALDSWKDIPTKYQDKGWRSALWQFVKSAGKTVAHVASVVFLTLIVACGIKGCNAIFGKKDYNPVKEEPLRRQLRSLPPQFTPESKKADKGVTDIVCRYSGKNEAELNKLLSLYKKSNPTDKEKKIMENPNNKCVATLNAAIGLIRAEQKLWTEMCSGEFNPLLPGTQAKVDECLAAGMIDTPEGPISLLQPPDLAGRNQMADRLERYVKDPKLKDIYELSWKNMEALSKDLAKTCATIGLVMHTEDGVIKITLPDKQEDCKLPWLKTLSPENYELLKKARQNLSDWSYRGMVYRVDPAQEKGNIKNKVPYTFALDESNPYFLANNPKAPIQVALLNAFCKEIGPILDQEMGLDCPEFFQIKGGTKRMLLEGQYGTFKTLDGKPLFNKSKTNDKTNNKKQTKLKGSGKGAMLQRSGDSNGSAIGLEEVVKMAKLRPHYLEDFLKAGGLIHYGQGNNLTAEMKSQLKPEINLTPAQYGMHKHRKDGYSA